MFVDVNMHVSRLNSDALAAKYVDYAADSMQQCGRNCNGVNVSCG